MTHFVILFRMGKIAFLELPVSPAVAVLMQNQNEDIWNFYSSPTLHIGKLICDFRSCKLNGLDSVHRFQCINMQSQNENV